VSAPRAAIALFLGVLLCSREASADDLRLEEVLSSIDQTFPLVLAAVQERAEAEGNALSADGAFDPSLRASATYEPISGYRKQYGNIQLDQPTTLWGTTFFAGYRYGSGKIPIYYQELETNDYVEARAGVRVPLWRDGPIDRRRAAIPKAELGRSLAKLSVDERKIETRRLAALRYWDWVSAGQRLAAMRSWLALAQSRDAGLAQRSERGDIPEIDRTENQRTILQRRSAVIGAERDFIQAQLELGIFIRGADGTASPPPASRLPATLPSPPVLDAVSESLETERALARRPDLKRLDVVRERSQIDVDLARNQQKPGIDVTLFGAQQFGPGDPARSERVVGASLILDIPIRTRVQTGRERAATASIAKVEEQKRFARDRISADVRIALATFAAARDRGTVAESELAVATSLAQAELSKFDLGEGNLLLVNLREQASAEAAIRRIDALTDVQRAAATFRAATAKDLGGE